MLFLFLLIGILSQSTLSNCSCSIPAPTTTANNITFGRNAKPCQIPYQVSIVNNGIHHCSGTIISDEYILTAAHCLIDFDATSMEVNAGVLDLESEDHLTYRIAEFIFHEYYIPHTYNNDIAIIHLLDHLPLGIPNVNKIELAPANASYKDGFMATVSGWGYVNQYMAYSSLLKYTRVILFTREDCRQLMDEPFSENMLCAGIPSSSHSPCYSESGGPLMYNDQLYGVISYGKRGCFDKDHPIMFVQIGAVRDWIFRSTNI